MNHDYAHCLDYTPDCPEECFRAQLQRDLEERRSEFIGVPLTCSHLCGTVECKLANASNKIWMGEWIPVSERLPEANQIVIVSIKGEVDADWIAVDRTGYGSWYRCMKDVMSVDAWMPLPKPWKG